MARLSTVFCFALCVFSASALRYGYDWEIRNLPYMVSIQQNEALFSEPSGGAERHLCGGSIIAPQWILTVATCVGSPTNIQIVAGTANIEHEESGTQKRYAVEVIKHPNFNSTTKRNNVALIKLDRPLAFGSNVQAVQLDKKGFVAGDDLTISGWGNYGSSNPALEAILASIEKAISRGNCNNRYGSYIGGPFGYLLPVEERSPVKEDMFCGGSVSNDRYQVLTCPGDEGSPAISARTKKQVGIISWGNKCQQYHLPNVYVNVANHIPWIQEQTGLSF